MWIKKTVFLLNKKKQVIFMVRLSVWRLIKHLRKQSVKVSKFSATGRSSEQRNLHVFLLCNIMRLRVCFFVFCFCRINLIKEQLLGNSPPKVSEQSLIH